jgi:hypothetical protein
MPLSLTCVCVSLQPDIADFMSRLDSVHYEVRSAKVDGLVTSSKIFAKYGARDVETGPIQLLKSKLLRYLRPFNPGTHPVKFPCVVVAYI